MTGKGAKDLTDSEKLNLILTKLSDIEARLAKFEARRNGVALPTTVSDPDSDLWMDYRDAAKLMQRPQGYFRMRNADGTYKHFPQIERWQPGGFRTRLYVRREHVERWIKASQVPSPALVEGEAFGAIYAGALPILNRLGARKTMRAFGLR
jgi:hypothetical protein